MAELERNSADDQRRLISQFNPTNWCPPPAANGPELVLRIVATTPEPIQLGPSARNNPVTLMRGEDREDLIEAALNTAEVTRRVRALQPTWNWVGDNSWRTHGSGNVDLTTLELELQWPAYRIRQPLTASCSVLTGRTKRNEPGVVLAFDIAFNIIELNEYRQPSQIAHRSTPPPAPAALTLTELANLMHNLLTVPDIALDLTAPLTGVARGSGAVGMWLSLNGLELERVVDLRSVEKLRGASQVSRFETQAEWPLSKIQDGTRVTASFVHGFLNAMLEDSGHRRFRAALASATAAGTEPSKHSDVE